MTQRCTLAAGAKNDCACDDGTGATRGEGPHDAPACSTAHKSPRSTRENMKLPVLAMARMADRSLNSCEKLQHKEKRETVIGNSMNSLEISSTLATAACQQHE